MQPLAFFGDGYTVEGAYLACVERLYPPLRFSFRPTTTDERSAFWQSCEKQSTREQDRRAAAFLAGKLTAWDVKDGKDNPVLISEANLRLIHPNLFAKLLLVVLGHEPWDADPGQPADKDREALNADAKQAGQSPGEIEEARDRKN